MTDTKNEPAAVEETWRYAGYRLLKGNQLAHAWVPEGSTDELLFKRLPASGIGGAYTVEVVHKPDGGTSVLGSARFQPALPPADSTVRAVWRSRSEQASRARQLHLAERRLASDDVVEKHMKGLLLLVRTARTRADKEAIVSAAYRRLTAAVWED